MADLNSYGEPSVLNHFIEDFIIQESSWPFTVKGQSYEFGKLPTDEPEVVTTTFYESETELFADLPSSDEESLSEGSYEMECCSYCGRTCTAAARQFGVKKFCSNTCAKLFGIPMPKRGGYSGGSRGRGKWKHHNYYGNKMNMPQHQKMSNVNYYNQSYEASTQVDERSFLRDAEDGISNDELDCLWKFEYVPASRWDAYEVAAFVRGISGCSEYAESFVTHEIDGYALMLVKEEHLVVGLKMKLGPALKLVGRVNQMKAEALEGNMHYHHHHLTEAAAAVVNTPRQKTTAGGLFTTRAHHNGLKQESRSTTEPLGQGGAISQVQHRSNGIA